jgi:chromosome segregation ATPase
MHHESLAAAATEKGLAAERAEHELQLAKLQHALAAQEAGAQELMQQKEELQQQLEKERSEYTAAADKQLTGAQHELQAAQSALGSSQAECDALRQQLERSQMGQDELAVAAEGARAALQAQLDAAESRAAELQAALDSASADAAEAREEAAEALAAAKSVNAGLDEQVQQLQRRAEEVRQRRCMFDCVCVCVCVHTRLLLSGLCVVWWPQPTQHMHHHIPGDLCMHYVLSLHLSGMPC